MPMMYVDMDALYNYYKQLVLTHNRAVEKGNAIDAKYIFGKISTVHAVAKLFGFTHELDSRMRKDKLHIIS